MTITYTHRDGLYINMTNRCSNRCDFCVRSYGDTLYGNLWLEREPRVEEVIESIDSHDLTQFSEVVFCGYGEPTERFEDMLEVCRHIKERAPTITVRLNTNGQSELICGVESTERFAGAFDIVSISLNTADSQSYDAVCHSEYGLAAYPAILAFAAHVKLYVRRVILSVVDTTIPAEEIEKCRKISEDIGVEFRLRDFI